MASSNVIACEYSHESSYTENLTTTGTRLPFKAFRDSPMRPRIPNAGLQVRQNAVEAPYLGPRGGSFELDVYWCGRGALSNTVTTDWWLVDLLTAGLGGGTTLTQGETAVAAGSDADTQVGSGTGTPMDNGTMWRTGIRGDTRCEGRWGVASSTSAGLTYNSLVGFGAICGLGDVIYKADLAYPTETGHGSERFLVHYNTSGAGRMYHGCVLTAVKPGPWTIGADPVLTLTYTYSYWQDYTASFPVNASVSECSYAPVMGGYTFFQTSGTTTASYVCPYETQFEIELGTTFKAGMCSTNAFADQMYSGFERTYTRARVTFKFPTWDSSWNTLYGSDGTSTVFKHALICSGTTQGRSVAVYFPRLFIVDPVPGHDDANGVVGVSATFQATEAITPEDTNDLSKSLFRMAFA